MISFRKSLLFLSETVLIFRKFSLVFVFGLQRDSSARETRREGTRPCCQIFDIEQKDVPDINWVRQNQGSDPLTRSNHSGKIFRSQERTTFVLASRLVDFGLFLRRTSYILITPCPFPFSSFALISARTAIDRSFLGTSRSYDK